MHQHQSKAKNITPKSGDLELQKFTLPKGRDQLVLLPIATLRRNLRQVLEWVKVGNFVVVTNHKHPVALLAPADKQALAAHQELLKKGTQPEVIRLNRESIRRLRNE